MASVTRIPSRTRFMPRDPRVAEPYRMTPAMALRLGVLGALVLFVFAVLFFRLWALQVLTGDRYLAAAQDNQLRTVREEAARGPILDHKGRVLVSNRIGTAAQVGPPTCRGAAGSGCYVACRRSSRSRSPSFSSA